MLRSCLWFILVTAGVAYAQTPATREAAYRANNRGVALLEQYKYKEGAEEFRSALAAAPDMFLPRVNLAIALYNVPDLEAAQLEAVAALKLKPDSPQAHYILGLIAKSQTRTDDALREFQQVLRLDPNDTGANINAGQLYAQTRQYDKATANFRLAVAAEPYNTSALYGLGQALLRKNAREEGQAVMQQFQKFRQNGAGTTLSNNYLEQGRYAEALASTGAEADLVDKRLPQIEFVGVDFNVLPALPYATPSPTLKPKKTQGRRGVVLQPVMPPTGGQAALIDFDSDGDLDIFEAANDHVRQRLLRNDGAKFVDVTAKSGVAASAKAEANDGFVAVAGDYDNDQKPDLLVVRGGKQLALYRNEDNGRFSDVTSAAKLAGPAGKCMAAALVDVDHDGDLDIFLAVVGANVLWRNNGDMTFADISEMAQMKGAGVPVAVVPTDFDNQRDVDLLIARKDGPPLLFQNRRDGTFREIAKEAGLGELKGAQCVAAGDVNKDGFTDFFFGSDSGSVFGISDGHSKFRIQPAPPDEAVYAAQFIDYDNDGLLDLLTVYRNDLKVWRNIGTGWEETRQPSFAISLYRPGKPGSLVTADLDNDGDTDLIYRNVYGVLYMVRNEGGNRNASVKVNLRGLVGNRSGIGAKVDMRAGSLGQKLEYYAASPAPAPADVIFGLGPRKTADAVRILWPSGIVQAEIAGLDALARKPLSVTELDLKPSSCPYLYTWNGEKFEFITDFMGSGEMGYWVGPGAFNRPDPDEYVRLTDKQLQPTDGRYELRVTNELEEVLFVDHLKLIAIAHPADTEVYPDEGLGHSPYPAPLKIYKTRRAQPPLAAIDDTGVNVLPQLREIDRKYPSNFKLDKVRGYAGEHSLTLTLPGGAGVSPANAPSGTSSVTIDLGFNGGNSRRKQAGEDAYAPRCVLLMNGWTDYAFSSDNVAASQSGKAMRPPVIQVKDKEGVWRDTNALVGIPIGRPQTVTVDLTGKFLSDSREIRIVTNMRVYYDQILVETGAGDFPVEVNELAPSVADLRWRGFSAAISAGGNAPDSYDYAKVGYTSPWKVAPGRYTREGDVRELLDRTDDNFVISRVGDELRLSFDAKQLPPLPAGWKRTFLLYSDGFSKELDINSATPHGTGPLPFHGMTKYPYEWPETYPLTPEREALQARYNTRIVNSELSYLFGY